MIEKPPVLEPPPTLFTPPMLANPLPSVIGSRLDLGQDSFGGTSPRVLTPESSTDNLQELTPTNSTLSVPDDPSLTNIPAPISRTKLVSPPQPVREQNFTVFQQGLKPPVRDYLSNLPDSIKMGANFIHWLLKDQKFVECHALFTDFLKQQVPLNTLVEIAKYYSELKGLWCSVAESVVRSEHTIVFIPLHYEESTHQAKLYIKDEKISGIEFSEYEEQKWKAEAPDAQRYIIGETRIVKMRDGSEKEIASPKEEQAAILSGKVPLGINLGKERRFKGSLSSNIEFKDKKPTLKKKGKDGTFYYVFREIGNIEETRKAHPEAYCREYWMAKDGWPQCYLLNKHGERVNEEFYVELADGELELLSSYTKKKKKDRIPMEKKNFPTIEHFYIAILIPPTLATQKTDLSTIRSVPNGFISTDGKAYIMTFDGEKKKFQTEIQWEVNLKSSVLKPLYEGEQYLTPSELIPSDRFPGRSA